MDAIAKKAQKYFKGNNKPFIWATEDGNFFWDKMFAENYARTSKKSYFKIERNDSEPETEETAKPSDELDVIETAEEPKKEKKTKSKRARK